MNNEQPKMTKNQILVIVVLSVVLVALIALNFLVDKNNNLETETPKNDTSVNITEEDQEEVEEEISSEDPAEEQKTEEKQEETSKKEESKNEETKQKNQTNTTPKQSGTTINKSGNYNLTGNYECLKIKATGTVIINLNGASIKCTSGPAIYVDSAAKVTINTTKDSTITSTTTTTLDGAIYSKANLAFEGSGTLKITSNYDGIVSKDNLVFNNGTYIVNASDDGIRGKDSVTINGGKYTVTAKGDGIKASEDVDKTKGYVIINKGTFTITSGNDGIQAESYLYINGGTYTIKTRGGYTTSLNTQISSKGFKAETELKIKNATATLSTGDDAIHSNSNVTITSGNIKIQTNDDAIHADNKITINGGTINSPNCYEGLEASSIYINGGNTTIKAIDDGLNAADGTNTGRPGDHFQNSKGIIEITAGTLKVISAGDGFDSNGVINIKGGTTYVESSSRSPEEAIDHSGVMTITGGTIITVSKNVANDDGLLKSEIPCVFQELTNTGSGKITIGNISYTPTINDYKYIMVASKSLSTGSNTLNYGNNNMTVNLTTGIINIPYSPQGPGRH